MSRRLQCRHRLLGQILAETYWFASYLAASAVGWLIPLAHHSSGHRRPVVLVPGFIGRGASYFRLRRALIARGHPVFAPDFGFQVGSIEKKARLLGSFLEEHGIEDCILIGHSMGGFIAACLVNEHPERVYHLITMASPIAGLKSTRLLPFVPACRQMTRGSRVQRTVYETLARLDNHTNVVTWFDEIILSNRLARVQSERVQSDREWISAHLGHVQLILSGCAIDMVCEILDSLPAR